MIWGITHIAILILKKHSHQAEAGFTDKTFEFDMLIVTFQILPKEPTLLIFSCYALSLPSPESQISATIGLINRILSYLANKMY